AAIGAAGDTGDKDAFEDAMGIGLVQVAVLVDVRLTLVTVADDEFWMHGGLAAGFPLDTGGEPAATTTAYIGGGHFGDGLFLAHLEEDLEITLVRAASDGVLDRVRLDHPGVAGEELHLVLEKG